jgi:hypothetical protein
MNVMTPIKSSGQKHVDVFRCPGLVAKPELWSQSSLEYPGIRLILDETREKTVKDDHLAQTDQGGTGLQAPGSQPVLQGLTKT